MSLPTMISPFTDKQIQTVSVFRQRFEWPKAFGVSYFSFIKKSNRSKWAVSAAAAIGIG